MVMLPRDVVEAAKKAVQDQKAVADAAARFRAIDRSVPIPAPQPTGAFTTDVTPRTIEQFRSEMRPAGMTPSAPGFAALPTSQLEELPYRAPMLGGAFQPVAALGSTLGVPQAYRAAQQGILGAFTGSNPVESVQQGVRGFLGDETYSGEDVGFARLLPEGSRARQMAGTAAEIALDPITLATAGVGGAAQAAPRAIRPFIEPFVRGPFSARLGAETGVGTAFSLGMEEATERGVPAPLALAGGLALGAGGIAAAQGARGAAAGRTRRCRGRRREPAGRQSTASRCAARGARRRS